MERVGWREWDGEGGVEGVRWREWDGEGGMEGRGVGSEVERVRWRE